MQQRYPCSRHLPRAKERAKKRAQSRHNTVSTLGQKEMTTSVILWKHLETLLLLLVAGLSRLAMLYIFFAWTVSSLGSSRHPGFEVEWFDGVL